jgi:hypothetical protein
MHELTEGIPPLHADYRIPVGMTERGAVIPAKAGICNFELNWCQGCRFLPAQE